MMATTHSMINANELNLRLDSTLQELPLWQVQIELDSLGNELATRFEQEPLLPGIILTKDSDYVGMISRQKFFEHMSRPYSFGLYSMRPIEIMYGFLQPQVFQLCEMTPIVEATQMALQRSPERVYEPILVKTKSGRHGLIDFHQLLLAHSQIHILTLNHLQQVEEQSKIAKAGFRDLQHNYTRLVQHEKMAALGQLVAGIAHEINNPINFIAGNLVHAIDYTQNLLRLISLYQQYYPEPDPEIQTLATEIDAEFLLADFLPVLNSMQIGCDRISQIVRSLRNFSRLDESDKKTVNIHEGIDSTLLILQNRLKNAKNRHNITVIKEYGNLAFIECYPGLLNQVFMNLLINAIDALEEQLENNFSQSLIPTIRIRTEITDEQQLIISIVDNGSGISEAVQQRIFDPFFTTKQVGKGTGLGLSISYQIIVQKHGGQLYCISALGQGTEFIIKIPVK